MVRLCTDTAGQALDYCDHCAAADEAYTLKPAAWTNSIVAGSYSTYTECGGRACLHTDAARQSLLPLQKLRRVVVLKDADIHNDTDWWWYCIPVLADTWVAGRQQHSTDDIMDRCRLIEALAYAKVLKSDGGRLRCTSCASSCTHAHMLSRAPDGTGTHRAAAGGGGRV